MKVLFFGNRRTISSYQDIIKSTINNFFDRHHFKAKGEISIYFVSSRRIHSLNKKYRQIDQPTDVLSFPLWENISKMPKTGKINLGDIFICLKFVSKDELKGVVEHSLNHLVGKHH